MISLLLALYPARWRLRYGDEFRAILESRPLGPFDVADVLLGAFDARFRATTLTEAPASQKGPQLMLRIGGYGAIAGGTAWVLGFVGASLTSGTDDQRSFPWVLLLTFGTAAILMALIGLSAFQARQSPRLSWAAFAIPAIGTVISLVGLLGMAVRPNSDAGFILGLNAWSVWALGCMATIVGCLLFAAATIRASVLSRAGAIGLLVSSGLVLLLAAGLLGPTIPESSGTIVLLGSLLGFAGSWITLGRSALRSGPIRAITAAI